MRQQDRQAAQRALAAGFDGVEVHAGNGYLLEQFQRDSMERPEDACGGSIENRARLLLEVVDAVSEVWGAGSVGVRLSPLSTAIGAIPLDSAPLQTHDCLARQLGARGLAYLHVVQAGCMAKTAAPTIRPCARPSAAPTSPTTDTTGSAHVTPPLPWLA